METRFNGLAERVAYAAVATFPEDEPGAQGPQAQMRAFMRGVERKIYENPASIGLPVLPDDSLGDWELQKSKPKLIDAMRKVSKKIDDFHLLLMKLGETGRVEGGRLAVGKEALRLAPKTLDMLRNFGLQIEISKTDVTLSSPEFPELPGGWKALAGIASQCGGNALTVFSHALFDPSRPGSCGVFRALTPDREAFRTLEEFFASNAYILVENREDGVSVDWVKNYAKKEEPLKAHWAERSHGGLSIWYDYRREHAMLFGLRVPMYREILSRFDEMDPLLKSFVVAQTKHCDGCGYCTQTDKTGLRQRLLVTVECDGQHDLCTMFPGFTYTWNRLDAGIAEGVMGFLSFTDRVLVQK